MCLCVCLYVGVRLAIRKQVNPEIAIFREHNSLRLRVLIYHQLNSGQSFPIITSRQLDRQGISIEAGNQLPQETTGVSRNYCRAFSLIAEYLEGKIGPDRDLNPGPLAPKAKIIPLDHRAIPLSIFLCLSINFSSQQHCYWSLRIKERLQWGSNSWPLVYKTSALATELWSQMIWLEVLKC